MCALCGSLGAPDHWTDAHARPGVFTQAGDPAGRRRERALRVNAANRVLKHLGMTLADWQGASFILSTATGKSVVVDTLSDLWAQAEAVTGRRADPLDAGLMARLEAAHG